MAASAPRTPSPRSKRSFEGRKIQDRPAQSTNHLVRSHGTTATVPVRYPSVRQANTARSRRAIQRALAATTPYALPADLSRHSTPNADATLHDRLQPRPHCVRAKHQHRSKRSRRPPRQLSQPTQECFLASPEAARPLLAGSRLYSAREPNGRATFSLLVLAPDHLNRHGGGNKEVIRPDCQVVGAAWSK